MLNKARFVQTSDWRTTVAELEIIELGNISAQSLAGITYFSIEGRNYTLNFDYSDNSNFFDGFTSTDGLFYDYGIRLVVAKEEHYIWIPKIGGLSINYKTGIVKVTGLDSVARAIKKLQDTEIDIEKFDSDLAKTLTPFPIDVQDSLFYDRFTYRLSSAIDHVLTTSGVDHTKNYMGFGLPAIVGSYDVIDAGLDDEYVWKAKFEANLAPDEVWHFQPQKLTSYVSDAFKPRYYFIHQTLKGKVFGFQQFYRAMSKRITGATTLYRLHQYIYRVVGILYDDKPFFYDLNNDGESIYDGRIEESYIFPFGTGNVTETYAAYDSSVTTADYNLALNYVWLQPTNYQYFTKSQWRAFRLYIHGSAYYNLENPANLNTGLPTPPFDPEPDESLTYWFDDNKETLKYADKIPMDIYKTEKFKIDAEEQVEQRKKTNTLEAADMMKQMLFMSNLIMVTNKDKIDIVDKSILVDKITGEETTSSTRDIVDGDPPDIIELPKPTVQAWDSEVAGNLLGQIGNNGTLDIITGGVDYYLNFTSNTTRAVVVYYTLDGTTPQPGTDGTSYFRPGITARILVSGNQIIRAFSYRQGASASELLMVNINEIESTVIPRPIISPKQGFYRDNLIVTIECDDVNATIYYTADGSTPSAVSTEYTTPLNYSNITESKDVIISAIAIRGGFTNSEITKAKYSIFPTMTINRHDIIELSKESQIFDIDKLSAFSNVGHADQIERYLKQFYETKLDRFFEVVKVVVDYPRKINVRDFVMINSNSTGLRFVAGARTDILTGLQHLTCWECEI